MVAPEAVAEQAAAFEHAAEQLALTLDFPVERLVWVEAPLTATVIDQSDSDAAVAVWTVSILGARGAGSPQQVWRTVRVDLERLDDRWLVVSATPTSVRRPLRTNLPCSPAGTSSSCVAGWDPIVAGVGL